MRRQLAQSSQKFKEALDEAIAAHEELEGGSKMLEEQLEALKAEHAALTKHKQKLETDLTASQQQVLALEAEKAASTQKSESLAAEVSPKRRAEVLSS